MKKGIVAFFAIVAVSVLIGMATHYIGGIVTFLVLGLIAAIVTGQYRAHNTKPIALELLKQENPSEAELSKCIEALGGSSLNDTESKELIRKLMAKRDALTAK